MCWRAYSHGFLPVCLSLETHGHGILRRPMSLPTE